MLDGGLDEGQTAELEAGARVFERTGDLRRSRKSLFDQRAADFELWIRPGLDPPEQFHDVLIADECRLLLWSPASRVHRRSSGRSGIGAVTRRTGAPAELFVRSSSSSMLHVASSWTPSTITPRAPVMRATITPASPGRSLGIPADRRERGK
jgi:hypothetical protein